MCLVAGVADYAAPVLGSKLHKGSDAGTGGANPTYEIRFWCLKMSCRTCTSEAEMTQKISIRAAQARLSELTDGAMAGEDIVILRDGKPAVRLVAIRQAGFKIGLLQGKLRSPPDFLEALDEHELADWEPND
jgi:antitoxin (DNA-binding transcriptional repressor) of toxin-antitoxin stability system